MVAARRGATRRGENRGDGERCDMKRCDAMRCNVWRGEARRGETRRGEARPGEAEQDKIKGKSRRTEGATRVESRQPKVVVKCVKSSANRENVNGFDACHQLHQQRKPFATSSRLLTGNPLSGLVRLFYQIA